MSFDIRESIDYIISGAVVASSASVACLMSYTGSVWPVVSSMAAAFGCSVMAAQSFKIWCNSDSVVERVASCIAGIFLSIATFFYITAAIDFYSCETTHHSDIVVYYATDSCNEMAKENFIDACKLFILGLLSVTFGCAINNLIGEDESYAIFV